MLRVFGDTHYVLPNQLFLLQWTLNEKKTNKQTNEQTFRDPPLDPRWISWIATFYLLRHVMMMIIIKVNYNYHKKISQNPLRQFLKALLTLTILYVENCRTTNNVCHKISYHVTSKVMTSLATWLFPSKVFLLLWEDFINEAKQLCGAFKNNQLTSGI